MTQKTNLNISPYYDDFDKDDQFYKVLFKPGFPVQARELSTLQSILQNQIESFGTHMFKDGSMVIPGNIAYDEEYFSIKVENDHLGIPISLYLNELKGLRLRGEVSGVVVIIDNFLYPEDNADVDQLTLFIKYVESGSDNLALGLFDGENLIVEETFSYGNTVINSGETVISLIDDDASYIGCSVSISSGVYFIRGTFVEVPSEKIVLNPYNNTPTYRVGLSIDEQLITAKDDDGLYDNARGFSNFAAPGADRLKIKTSLSKKDVTDTDDTNFVELIRLRDGEIQYIADKTDYNIIRDYFARRTFEESGNYSLDKFDIDVLECLNDGTTGDGVYGVQQITELGNQPSDDLMCVRVSSGKAYVRGYDVSLESSSLLDVEKPRDKKTVDSSLVPYQMGTVFKVNHVSGVPAPNINDETALVELYNKRTTADNEKQGDKIGEARIYSFAVSDASYTGDSTEWDLHLFDVQIFTKIELNQNVTNTEVPLTSFVRGVSSGATGYVSIVSGGYGCIHLSEVTGEFIVGEQLIINEDTSFIRSTKSVKTFGIQDVKGIFQNTSSVTGYAVSFTSDTVLNRVIAPNISNADKITITGAGATTNGSFNFAGISTGTILRYTPDGETVERFNRIETVSGDGLSVTLSAVPTITGICNGALNSSKISTTFAFGVPNISIGDDNGLYAKIDNKNVSDVNLGSSTLLVGKNITGESTDGSGTLTFNLASSGISSAFYESFDEERYSVHYSDGSIEDLTSDQFVLSADGQTVTINGLETSESNIVVSTTLKKQALKSKVKNFDRSQKILVDKTAVGINTTLTGMSISKNYGLRVEDKEISLNVPDAVNIVGVYESLNTLSPTLDRFQFPSGLSLDTASILGERIYGEETGAVAQIVGRISATEIEVSIISSVGFSIGEIINFEESLILSTLQGITLGNNLNITNRFKLDKGQREQFYDYSRIVRKINFPAPSRKLLVVFDKYSVPSNDTGDFYTVGSYNEERFSKDIPEIKDGLRASDTLDFRPRVSDFVGSGSPFAFSNRTFSSTFNPSTIVTPNESSIIGYNHYLPRTDIVALDNQGDIVVILGQSSTLPVAPSAEENMMKLATIELPAYLYDTDDAKITVEDNVRFTMKDIGKLEDRIENLEITSSLSLLELDTKTLQIQDADGLSRFKTGFFVDDFKNLNLIDISDDDCNVTVDTEEQILTVPNHFWSLKPELALSPSINSDTADFSTDLTLLDPNVTKTGDLITLDYAEIEWLGNPLASRVENVNPFNLTGFIGTIKLDPANDTWVRNIEVSGGSKTITGNVARTYVEKKQTSSVADTHIRSRNVSFAADGVRPVTQFYPFFDKTSGINLIPKLVEINMVNGIFSKGETVEALKDGKRVAIFRIAQPNHKKGDILTPTNTFNSNPYDTSSSLGTSYSASSTVLNVDVNSISDEAKGKFYGYIPYTGTITLLGQTSKAQATVTDVKLVSDTYGDVFGSFFFEDPLSSPPPSLRFKVGTSTFKISSDPDVRTPEQRSMLLSEAEGQYISNGKVNTIQSTTITVRVPPPVYKSYYGGGGQKYVITSKFGLLKPTKVKLSDYRRALTTGKLTKGNKLGPSYGTNNTQKKTVSKGQGGFGGGQGNPTNQRGQGAKNNAKNSGSSTSKTSKTAGTGKKNAGSKNKRGSGAKNKKSPLNTLAGRNVQGLDPLSQTFTVDEDGAFLTSVDLFFARKDPNENLVVEIRTVELGQPTTQLVQDFARVVVSPDDIQTSTNGEVATNVTFPSPVFLEAEQEYALVLGVSQSIQYEVWISRMGDKTVNTQSLPDAESVVVTRQYTRGSLFKSQNGSIWTASQYEDLKFKLYKAAFNDEPGTVFFYNSPMETRSGNFERLLPNSIKTLPRKLKVGITTTSDTDSLLTNGVKVSDSTSASAIQGYIENVGGPVGVLTVTNAGSGFQASQIYTGVPLYNITGNGSGMTARIETNSSGQIVTANITSNTGGSGYVVGDVLGITTSNVIKGSDALISVTSTTGKSTLYLKNVQGEEFTTGQALVVDNGSSQVSLASTTILSSTTYDSKYEGNVIEVSHFNHGMTADNNFVTLADVEPNTTSILLTDALSLDDQVISVASTSEFSTYAGISTSQGYIKINSEIIYYNSIGSGQLGIGTRGVDGTIPRTHNTGDQSFKYELNGFDLRQINNDHDMASMPVSINNLRDIDTYYLSLDRGALSSGDSQSSFTDESNVGGSEIFASQNYQFDSIIPRFNTLLPSSDTTILSQIRTVSGTSAGGNEVSFIDQGFEFVEIDNENKLSTPRLLCSQINETNRLSELPLNRSVTFSVTMATVSQNLSPVIDIQNGVLIYQRNRLNRPILDYVKDGRSQNPSGDPHAAVYISNQVNLKNPATSLKVLVSAFRDPSADFRAFYQLVRADGTETELAYNPFPGFDNLEDTDGDGFGDKVIDESKNSGRPDSFVLPSIEEEFKEYQFSVDNLEEFIGYKIKFVFSGTNEAKAPKLKDLRTIALA